MKREVVVAGHICLDITPKLKNSILKNIQELLLPGKLINLEGVEISSGGAVANTGFALQKLGIGITPMALVGQDSFGDVLNKIIFDNTTIQVKQVPGISTSYSIVLAIEGTDRIILHDPAGNNHFGFKNIDFKTVAKAALFHFGYPPLMKRIYENGGQELTEIFKRVKQSGVSTSLDMSLPDINSESGQINWIRIMQRVLPNVDIFMPSIEEAMFIFNYEKYKEITALAKGREFVNHIESKDIVMLGERIIAYGCAVLAIKCGAKGLYVKTAEAERLEKMGMILKVNASITANAAFFEESYHVQNFKSALAAGDTTIAGFLAGLIRGCELKMSAKVACMTGAMCCRAYDAVSTIEEFKNVISKIEDKPIKNAWGLLENTFAYDAVSQTWIQKA